MRHLRTYMLFESAKEFLELPPDVGLVIMDEKHDTIGLYFFNFSRNECLGMITITRKFKDIWTVNVAAAEDGYGPLLYKSAMMSVYPDRMCAARDKDIRPEAVNIWRRFYHEGHEVRKTELQDDEKYNFWDDEQNDILNVAYSRPSSIWLKKMIARGERLTKEHKADAKNIRRVCLEYFKQRYNRE